MVFRVVKCANSNLGSLLRNSEKTKAVERALTGGPYGVHIYVEKWSLESVPPITRSDTELDSGGRLLGSTFTS